jgi:hypothetical protein
MVPLLTRKRRIRRKPEKGIICFLSSLPPKARRTTPETKSRKKSVPIPKKATFPSVTKTIINFSLIEEAEKHYLRKRDEFPMEYSAGLRSRAALKLADDEDMQDVDED